MPWYGGGVNTQHSAQQRMTGGEQWAWGGGEIQNMRVTDTSRSAHNRACADGRKGSLSTGEH